MKREQLGSRLGFIMLSAGCAIGCGNMWKFPWMCGQNGGGSFMLVYIICLIILGIPALTMEFAIGRAAQTSPLNMYKKLEKPGQKWGGFGIICLIGNLALMAFYTVVCGWLIYYFCKYVAGRQQTLGFASMIASPTINVVFLLITVVLAFFILSFHLQGGLERITKFMMSALLVLMLVLAVHSLKRCRTRLTFLSETGYFQDQRICRGCRHEPGIFHAFHRYGKHGDLWLLYRKRPHPHGRSPACHHA